MTSPTRAMFSSASFGRAPRFPPPASPPPENYHNPFFSSASPPDKERKKRESCSPTQHFQFRLSPLRSHSSSSPQPHRTVHSSPQQSFSPRSVSPQSSFPSVSLASQASQSPQSSQVSQSPQSPPSPHSPQSPQSPPSEYSESPQSLPSSSPNPSPILSPQRRLSIAGTFPQKRGGNVSNWVRTQSRDSELRGLGSPEIVKNDSDLSLSGHQFDLAHDEGSKASRKIGKQYKARSLTKTFERSSLEIQSHVVTAALPVFSERQECGCCGGSTSGYGILCHICTRVCCGNCLQKLKCHLCSGRDHCPRQIIGGARHSPTSPNTSPPNGAISPPNCTSPTKRVSPHSMSFASLPRGGSGEVEGMSPSFKPRTAGVGRRKPPKNAKPPSPGSTISSSGPHAAFLTNLKGNRPTTKTSLSTSLSIPSLLDKESGCPEKDGEEKKLRKGNKEREKKKGKGRSKRQKIEEEDHEKLLVERRIQNFKQQADFRNSLSNMDLLKSLYHCCVIGDCASIQSVLGIHPNFATEPLSHDSHILPSPFFQEGDRPLDVAMRFKQTEVVDFLFPLTNSEETNSSRFLSPRPHKRSVGKKTKTPSRSPISSSSRRRKTPLSSYLTFKGDVTPLDAIQLLKGDLGNGIYSYHFDVPLKDFVSEGISLENLVILLSLETVFRKNLWRAFFLTLPNFCSPEIALELLIKVSCPESEKQIAKALQYWMSVAWEEDWATTKLKTMLTKEVMTGQKYTSLISCFLLDLLRAEGDAQVIKEVSKKYEDDELSIYGVAAKLGEAEETGKEKKREKEKDKEKKKKGKTPSRGTGERSLAGSIEEQASGPFSGHNYPPIFRDVSEWVDWDNLWLTEQFTLYHFNLCRAVKPRELMRWSVSKNKSEECPNLWKFVTHFNELTHWLVSQIVVRVRRTERVLLVEKVIMIARLSIHINNFFGAKAFFTAVNHPAISRLTQTFECLKRESQENFTFLSNLLSMNANGAEYRECLLKAQPPYVPFVGLHTKDLIFYRDGNSDELERGVNFGKFEKMWRVCSLFFRGMTEEYPMTNKCPRFIDHVASELQALTEDQMFKWSYRVEPKNVETAIAEFISNELKLIQEKNKMEEERDLAQKTAERAENIQQSLQEIISEKDKKIQELMCKVGNLEKQSQKQKGKELEKDEERETKTKKLLPETKKESFKANFFPSQSVGSLSLSTFVAQKGLEIPFALSQIVENEVSCLMEDVEERPASEEIDASVGVDVDDICIGSGWEGWLSDDEEK